MNRPSNRYHQNKSKELCYEKPHKKVYQQEPQTRSLYTAVPEGKLMFLVASSGVLFEYNPKNIDGIIEGILFSTETGAKVFCTRSIVKQQIVTMKKGPPLIVGQPFTSRSLKEVEEFQGYKVARIVEEPIIREPKREPIREPITRDTIITKDNVEERVFIVKPELQNDIYSLYVYKNGNTDTLLGTAHIPDYKTSVLMNRLFRRIKENDHLDALQESDDEAEFEDEREDKFVDLSKQVKMVCQFNNRFRKWVPVRRANPRDMVSRLCDLPRQGNNNNNNNKLHPPYNNLSRYNKKILCQQVQQHPI